MVGVEIVNVVKGQDALEIEWQDGRKSSYHYIWLRDNAPENRHANGQKLIDTLDIPLDVTARAVSFNGRLNIEWADDGSMSEFDPAWLRDHAYEMDAVAARNVEPKLWETAALAGKLPEFSFPTLADDNGELRGMLTAVRDLGFAIIHDVPPESEMLFKVVDLFGYVRETNYGTYFDVKVTPNPTNLAFTGATLGGHTDNPYRHPVPTLQLLHFLFNSVEGGDSTLVDGFRVAEALREENPDLFHLLATSPVTFRFQSEDADLMYTSTIIELDVNGKVAGIRFNNRSVQPFFVTPDEMVAFYAAYHAFGKLLEDDRYKITFKLDAGDLMLFDNQRVLHGRIGYKSSGKRHLQGCYADRDSLLSKLAVLERGQAG